MAFMLFDPWRYASDQGIAVFRCRLPESLLGLYSCNEPPLILVQEGLSEDWERVVLTHEVSHHDAPAALLRRVVHLRRDGVLGLDSAEACASRLAWERLLPARRVLALVRQGASVEDLAGRFSVPVEVVAMRLRGLASRDSDDRVSSIDLVR